MEVVLIDVFSHERQLFVCVAELKSSVSPQSSVNSSLCSYLTMLGKFLSFKSDDKSHVPEVCWRSVGRPVSSKDRRVK